MNEEIIKGLLYPVWLVAVSVGAYQIGKMDEALDRMNERDKERNK
jgi:hypothetical protein